MEHQLLWAISDKLKVKPDQLCCRVDIYEETILLHQFGNEGTTTRMVSALDIARSFTREIRLSSGMLPEGALWWGTGPEGQAVALWRKPQVWQVALQVEPFQPPRRFHLPMPGLVFVCSPGRPPKVYAAKKRPASLNIPLCHAPLFNVFHNGSTCPGTHRYPQEVSDIPESFFTSFFTRAGDFGGRSKKHPKDLLVLWEELDGRGRYPVRDLVLYSTVAKTLGLEE